MEDNYSTVGNSSSVLFLHDKVDILHNIFVRAGLILVYSLIFSICIIGNLAVILVVTLEWKGRLLSKFYLGNLAVANLSIAIFSIPQDLSVRLLERWIFGELMCGIFQSVTSLSYTASVLSLLVVSIERYMVLVHAFKGVPVCNLRRLKVVSILVWLLSAAASLPPFFSCGLVQIPADDKGTIGKTCVAAASMYNSATTDTIYFIAIYALPLALMSAMYLHIGVHVRKIEKRRNDLLRNNFQSRVLSDNNNGPCGKGNLSCASATLCNTLRVSRSYSCNVSSNCRGQMVPGPSVMKRVTKGGRSSRQLKTLGAHRSGIKTGGPRLSQVRCRKRQSLVRMLVFIFVTFALLNLPFHVRKFCVNFLPSFDMSSNCSSVISSSTILLMYVNCAVNPILYVLMSSRFRQSLIDLIPTLHGAGSHTSDCM